MAYTGTLKYPPHTQNASKLRIRQLLWILKLDGDIHAPQGDALAQLRERYRARGVRIDELAATYMVKQLILGKFGDPVKVNRGTRKTYAIELNTEPPAPCPWPEELEAKAAAEVEPEPVAEDLPGPEPEPTPEPPSEPEPQPEPVPAQLPAAAISLNGDGPLAIPGDEELERQFALVARSYEPAPIEVRSTASVEERAGLLAQLAGELLIDVAVMRSELAHAQGGPQDETTAVRLNAALDENFRLRDKLKRAERVAQEASALAESKAAECRALNQRLAILDSNLQAVLKGDRAPDLSGFQATDRFIRERPSVRG